MDKEREAFDKWYGIKPKGWFEAIRYNTAWKAWQASAQREGYKLVPVEINNEIESAMFSSVARGEMPCDIYKAMIGAQESTND